MESFTSQLLPKQGVKSSVERKETTLYFIYFHLLSSEGGVERADRLSLHAVDLNSTKLYSDLLGARLS